MMSRIFGLISLSALSILNLWGINSLFLLLVFDDRIKIEILLGKHCMKIYCNNNVSQFLTVDISCFLKSDKHSKESFVNI